MSAELKTSEAGPEQIYALLRPDEDLISATPIAWSMALRLGAHDETLGQINNTGDTQRLPTVALRVVGLNIAGEISIRWLDPDKALRVVPGTTHDSLLCRGERPVDVRSGWLLRTGDLLRVQ